MSWTKEELIREAFAELAIHGYVYDISPEELQTGLRRLDTMLAAWNGKGIRLGYPLPSSTSASSLSTDSNLPDITLEPVYLNLALRMAPGKGKQIAQDTRLAAKDGFNMLLSRAAMPPEQQFPSTLPVGAGNKAMRIRRSPFMPAPTDPITAGGDGPLDFT